MIFFFFPLPFLAAAEVCNLNSDVSGKREITPGRGGRGSGPWMDQEMRIFCPNPSLGLRDGPRDPSNLIYGSPRAPLGVAQKPRGLGFFLKFELIWINFNCNFIFDCNRNFNCNFNFDFCILILIFILILILILIF